MGATENDTPQKTYRRRDPMARDLAPMGLENYREIAEVATRFNRCPRTIKRWCQQGLRHIKVAGAVFIADADIKAFFETHAIGGNTPRSDRRKAGA